MLAKPINDHITTLQIFTSHACASLKQLTPILLIVIITTSICTPYALAAGATLSCGQYHNLACTADGSVWAWGGNYRGRLGDGTSTDRYYPVRVKDNTNTDFLSGIKSVAAGETHSLALASDGTLWSWGSSQYGQLGNGTDGTGIWSSLPIRVKGSSGMGMLSDVVAIAAGFAHSLALASDGTIWSWGLNNDGQLGNGEDGTTAYRSLPVQVKGSTGAGLLTEITAVAAGGNHSLALASDGTVWAWGNNTWGMLGDGNDGPGLFRSIPGKVKDSTGTGILTDIIAVAAGGSHSLALASDGTIWAWGYNESGQLGDGNSGPGLVTNLPVQVKNGTGTGTLNNIVALAGGEWFSLALTTEGTLWAWGANSLSQLGDGTQTGRPLPVQVKNNAGSGILSEISAMAAGQDFAVALSSDGTLWSWGYSHFGELGTGIVTARQDLPVMVRGSGGSGYLDTALAIFPEAANGELPFTVSFTCTHSSHATSFSWDFGDGNSSITESPTHTFSQYGAYHVTLTEDIADGTQSTSMLVNVLRSINVDAGNDQIVTEGTNVTLNGIASDPEGQSLAYVWSQTAGPNVTMHNHQTSTISFQAPDTDESQISLAFKLTVTAADNRTAKDTVIVTVQNESGNNASGSSGGGGCVMSHTAAFSLEWLLLLASTGLMRLRRKA